MSLFLLPNNWMELKRWPDSSGTKVGIWKWQMEFKSSAKQSGLCQLWSVCGDQSRLLKELGLKTSKLQERLMQPNQPRQKKRKVKKGKFREANHQEPKKCRSGSTAYLAAKKAKNDKIVNLSPISSPAEWGQFSPNPSENVLPWLPCAHLGYWF